MSRMEGLEFWKSPQGRQQSKVNIGDSNDSTMKSEPWACSIKSVSSRQDVSVARGLDHLSYLINIWGNDLKTLILDLTSEFSENSGPAKHPPLAHTMWDLLQQDQTAQGLQLEQSHSAKDPGRWPSRYQSIYTYINKYIYIYIYIYIYEMFQIPGSLLYNIILLLRIY